MNIQKYENPQAMAKSVAELLKEKVAEKAAKGEQFYLAVSGGSTPKTLFELLAKEYSDSISWNNLRFYWVDERCVAPEDSDSNYGVVKELLFNNIEINNSQIERMIGENNPSEEALIYSNTLSSQLPSKNSTPEFDLILLGMGDDGHTASIFPNQLELTKSERNCEVGVHPTSGQNRVTLTSKVINNAKETIFLVTGENKAQILKEIINKEDNYLQYPSAHITPSNGNLTWMVDNSAAALL